MMQNKLLVVGPFNSIAEKILLSCHNIVFAFEIFCNFVLVRFVNVRRRLQFFLLYYFYEHIRRLNIRYKKNFVNDMISFFFRKITELTFSARKV